jgi:hypothetical protein
MDVLDQANIMKQLDRDTIKVATWICLSLI